MEVSVQHEDFFTQEEFVDGVPQNWWCEDSRDKELVLFIEVTGTGSTESKSHRISVRHCCSSKSKCVKKEPKRRSRASHLHRSDVGDFGSSSGAVPGLSNMHCP